MDKFKINIQHIDKNITAGKINYNKVIIPNEAEPVRKEDKSYEVDISNAGRLRNDNTKKKTNLKSARDAFENSASEIKDLKREKIASGDLSEIWKLDEPETYEKWVDAIKNLYATRTHEQQGLTTFEPIKSYEDLSDEGNHYQKLASSIMNDYLSRRIYNTNSSAKADVDSIQRKIDELDEKFSDQIHDVAFNLYGGNPSIDDMWQFNTKFTVLLSKNMFSTLTKGSQAEINILMSHINEGVNGIKEAELRYEGDLDWLRFGIKLHDDWTVSYHANFDGCKESDGIQATSADELLQILASYNYQ